MKSTITKIAYEQYKFDYNITQEIISTNYLYIIYYTFTNLLCLLLLIIIIIH